MTKKVATKALGHEAKEGCHEGTKARREEGDLPALAGIGAFLKGSKFVHFVRFVRFVHFVSFCENCVVL